jgi:diguanylate cyclase (GGDEF)-like protein/PAS domain S-box-containing protein
MNPSQIVPLFIFIISGLAICGVTYLMRRNAMAFHESLEGLRLAASVFENSQEGILITTVDQIIVDVNGAFTDITGYSREEAVGRSPRILRSGRHDAAFYQEMRQTLARTGVWTGELWNRRKNGDVYPESLSISAVTGNDGDVTHYVGLMNDITRRKTTEEKIKRLAFYDSLTHLPNRRLLLDRLHHVMTTSERSKLWCALLFIDLDNFKTLNDTVGHDRGDLLLMKVAQSLGACVRESDVVSRFGGDEFVVVLQDLGGGVEDAAYQTETIGEKILASLDQSYLLAGHRHDSTCSIGATLFCGCGNTLDELLKQSDVAMYKAKELGGNVIRFYDATMQTEVAERAALETALRHGVYKKEFVLYYQPQVDGAGRLTGVEALLRWRHPTRGLVLPGEFMALAEKSGLIVPLGHWVLEAACAQLESWASQQELTHLTMSVNVSARQFLHPEFEHQVLAALEQTGADPNKLKLELTESLLTDDVEEPKAKMMSLGEHGVRFCLDDFGTGYSSLAYLKFLHLDEIKIDRSFVRGLPVDPNDAGIARAIIALAGGLGLTVLAEGVETQAQRDFLTLNGCRAYQGFLFGRPMPAREIEQLAVDASPKQDATHTAIPTL